MLIEINTERPFALLGILQSSGRQFEIIPASIGLSAP
jgi:hypothetical protein